VADVTTTLIPTLFGVAVYTIFRFVFGTPNNIAIAAGIFTFSGTIILTAILT
jgi:hypothetical protein